MNADKCPLCDYSQINSQGVGALNQRWIIECKRCGYFEISDTLLRIFTLGNQDKEQRKIKALLSGYSRERSFRKQKPPFFTSENYKEIALNDPLIPKSIYDKFAKLLNYYNEISEYFGEQIQLNKDLDYPITYSGRVEEFVSIINELYDMQYLKKSTNGYPMLTIKGLEFIKQKSKEITNKCFIAMWFDKEVENAKEVIKKAISDNKYDPIIVSDLEHNNLIDDEIIIGIKSSRFMVADLTGYRGGVYYEVGYAKGLAKEVILCCREDWFNGGENREAVHFDLNHRNIIVWKNEADLYEKLKKRIEVSVENH